MIVFWYLHSLSDSETFVNSYIFMYLLNVRLDHNLIYRSYKDQITQSKTEAL